MVDEFIRQKLREELLRGAPGERGVGRQVAVQRMGDLVDVVADAAQLREQRRVHGAIGGERARIDLAVQHQPLAHAGDGKPKLLRLRSLQRVVLIRHADADHPAARCLRVCSSSRHVVMPHQGWVRVAWCAT